MINVNHLGRRLAVDAVPWSPARLRSLALWLDAADASTITLATTKISQWNDKSGNGRNVTQGTDAERPTYTTNGQNGLPVATFAAGQTMAGTGFTHAGTWSCGVVVKNTNTQGVFQIGAINGNGSLLIESNLYKIRAANTGGATVTSVASTPAIVVGTSAASKQDIWKNGGKGTADAQSAVAASSVAFTVGGLNATTYRMNGFIAELVIVAAVMTTSEQRALTSYLSKKWGIA